MADFTSGDLNAGDAKVRAASLDQTTAAVLAMLDNSDGFARLRAFTDEEWKQAFDEDTQTIG